MHDFLPHLGQIWPLYEWEPMCHCVCSVPRQRSIFFTQEGSPTMGLILRLWQKPQTKLRKPNAEETRRGRKAQGHGRPGTQPACLPKLASHTCSAPTASRARASLGWESSGPCRLPFKPEFSGFTLEPDPRDWALRLLVISFAAWMEVTNYCSCIISTTRLLPYIRSTLPNKLWSALILSLTLQEKRYKWVARKHHTFRNFPK